MKTRELEGLRAEDLAVSRLGACTVPSPLSLSSTAGDFVPDWVSDTSRVLAEVELDEGDTPSPLAFVKAGARERIYFDPARLRAGIVTCGGLCPGLNNVVRGLVMELFYKYGVRDIVGFRYGFEGLIPGVGMTPVPLVPDRVNDIHKHGGSFLGLSRGAQNPAAMVDELAARGISVLFAIGGDGTQRGAHAIAMEARRRNVELAVVGVPKTIDNDVAFVDKTFGFDTAVEVARQAVDAAHTEARDARNGVGIVKLMGRDAGYIAAAATIASHDVNFCLVPEVPFRLETFLRALEHRLARRGHAVVVVAEGCAAHLSRDEGPRDASGNARYASGANDVGPLLRDAIKGHLEARHVSASVKYIDPSYMIRSVSANASDAVFCDGLARHAAHAGMAGFTDVLVGRWHRHFTLVPLQAVAGRHRRIDPDGGLWLEVLESTGQPSLHT